MKKPLFLIVIFLLIFVAVYSSPKPANLIIDFIDVGEGDSILIRTPHGASVLIDAGNLITGHRVLEYLRRRGVTSLDHLIFTHPHPDHIGGAFFIAQMVKIAKVHDNGYHLQSDKDIYRWYKELIRQRSDYELLQAGDTLKLDGVELKVLWPASANRISGVNNNSLVILLQYGDFRCLLMSDTTISVEEELLKADKGLKADILKAGHHGYPDASSQEFLREVSPDAAIMSISLKDIRGHQLKGISEKFKTLGIKTYRIDQDGDITITVSRDGKFRIDTNR